MSIIRAQLVGDVVSGSTFAGIVTATGFDGDLTGNVTGDVTGNLSGVAYSSFFSTQATFAANAGIASTALASITAQSLTGKPNIDVGIVTATSYIGSGLGITSLNATNLSTGTVPSAALGSGTADSSTFLRGDRVWSTVPTGGFSNMQVFTSPGSFFVPPTTTKLKVTVTGGGGALGEGNRGGSSGATGIAVFNVTSGSTIPVAVGAGGQSFPSDIPGGTSSFGGFVAATGGNNSVGGVASFPAPAPTYQARLGLDGGNGASGSVFSPLTAGGASYWGSAGVNVTFAPNPTPVTQGAYGAGGGVGPGPRQFSGIQGVVVVEW